MRLRNHPPHDLDCCLDRAALLTQEGSSAGFSTPLTQASPWIHRDSCAWQVRGVVALTPPLRVTLSPNLGSPACYDTNRYEYNVVHWYHRIHRASAVSERARV